MPVRIRFPSLMDGASSSSASRRSMQGAAQTVPGASTARPQQAALQVGGVPSAGSGEQAKEALPKGPSSRPPISRRLSRIAHRPIRCVGKQSVRPMQKRPIWSMEHMQARATLGSRIA